MNFAMSTGREALRELLRGHEGEVLHAYEDSEGYLTIGVGHLIDQRLGGRISQRISALILDEDIDTHIRELAEHYDWFERLDGVRQIAVVDLHFNLGQQRFSGFRKFIAAMERGEYAMAGAELVDSKWYAQVPRRARRIVWMVQTGRMPEDQGVGGSG